MKGVIVAAGRSSRLYPRTLDTPKPLLRIPDQGPTLLRRSVDLLGRHGVDDVTVVVGYRRDRIREALGTSARYVFNPFFAETNNMASLWLALNGVDDDVVYAHADLIYHPGLLERLLAAPVPSALTLLVDVGSVHEEAMKVRVEGDRFVESSKEIAPGRALGEWTGLAHLGREVLPALREAMEELLADRRFQEYDTAAFNLLAEDGVDFRLPSTDGLPWKEIDTEADLADARTLFEGHGDG